MLGSWTGANIQVGRCHSIKANDNVAIRGGLEGNKWCAVDHKGTEGWVFSDYLAADLSGSRVVVSERRSDIGVPATTYKGAGGAVAGATGGAIVGAIVGGPVGAAVGGVVGAAAGAALTPPKEVVTYVTTNRLDPVYLDGEVVVGASLPPAVELRQIPNYEYSYVYVNGQPVLVESGSRKIVYVFRS